MKFLSKILLSLLFIIYLPAQKKTTLKLNFETKKLPFGLEYKKSDCEPDITLVLSGGGSRGLSQIGILKALEEAGISFNSIVGTSMGSIIGGLYASGYEIKELEKVGLSPRWTSFTQTKEMNRKDLFVDQKIAEDKAFLTLRLDGLKPLLPNSLNTGKAIAAFLNDLYFKAPLFSESDFERLLYNYKAVATNLIQGKAKVIESGSVVKAMRASSSVSLLMPPVKVDSLLLADGGLVSNIPVKIAKEYNPDYIIAVNTTSPLKSEEELKLPWNVADQIVSIPIMVNNKENLNYADFIISPEIGAQNGIDFEKADTLIQIGYQETNRIIEELKTDIKNKTCSLISSDEKVLTNVEFSKPNSAFESKLIERFKIYSELNKKNIIYEMNKLYSEGDIEDITAELTEEKNRTQIKFIIKQNEKIKSVWLNGFNIELFPAGISILEKLKDKPFNPKKTVNTLLKLLRFLRSESEVLSEIKSVTFNEKTKTLEVVVTEIKLDKLLVEGNDKTDEAIITREIPFVKGEKLNTKKLSQAIINLQTSNLFDEVELIVREEKNENHLVAKVDEKITGVARFGLRIDNEYSTQIAVDLRDENVLGTGSELGATLRSGLKNHSLILEHKSNRIFDTYLTYKIQAYLNRNEIKVYADNKEDQAGSSKREEVAKYHRTFAGVMFGLGTQVERFGNILMKLSYERNRISSIDNFEEKESDFNLFILNLSMHIDSQNKYPFPTSGFKILTSYESALPIIDSDVSYTKFLFDYNGYIPLGKEHTLFTRLKIGFGDPTMPLSKHFSFGGQQNFFGFRENEFVGRQIFVSSLGFRYKLPIKLIVDTYVKIRYDLGSIWAEKEALRFKDMKHGVGASLALETPIGPAEFSYGHSFTFESGLFNKGIIPGESYFYFTIGYYLN